MNFLAHIYLSGDDEELMLGNFMADSVKGKDYLNFTEGVQKGILLHRSIDQFTDEHLIIKEAKQLIRPQLGKYAGAAIDIYLDHFLARDWNKHHHEEFRDYTIKVMQTIKKYNDILPGHSKLFFEYAQKTDRLYTYKDLSGIEEVFMGMHKRVKMENNFNLAQALLLKNYNSFEQTFNIFFPLLKDFCINK